MRKYEKNKSELGIKLGLSILELKLRKYYDFIQNLPLFLPNIPQGIMKLILGEMSSLLFTNKNIKPQVATKLGFKFEFDTPEKALKNILK